MYNKKKTSKIYKKGKRYSKNANSSALNKTHFQTSENGVINLQRNDNCESSRQTSGTKLPVGLFRNPLISKRGWKQVKKKIKGKESSRTKGLVRCVGVIFVLFHPLALVALSVEGIILEAKDNIVNVFVNAGILANAIFHLINYLDDVDVLFPSTFDTANKSLARFWADLLIRELFLEGFQVVGLFYQFLNGGKSKLSFSFELVSFLVHLAGNIALLLGRQKEQLPGYSININRLSTSISK